MHPGRVSVTHHDPGPSTSQIGSLRLLSRFVTFELDRELADRAGDLIRERAERGQPLSVPDAIIAATAISHGLTLLTLNVADFEGIPGLSVAPLSSE